MYRFDFILHSEYFVLNLFRDFLTQAGFDLFQRDYLVKLAERVKADDAKISEIYGTIKERLAECLDTVRDEPGYYHNKFFKSDKSIGLVRGFFNGEFNFVSIV